MKVIRSSKRFERVPHAILAMGNFDGVHVGHQKIFSEVAKIAKKIKGTSVVFTYNPHPVKLLAPDASPKLIQTEEQKIASIAGLGIDLCLIEDFTHDFSKMSADQFLKEIILKKIAPEHIVIGYDFTFGKHRHGSIDTLKHFCTEHKIGLTVVEAVFLGEMLVSSTAIRKFLSDGDVENANKLLGKPFELTGTVIKGRGIGGEIGIHTANLETKNELIPPIGVYISKTLNRESVTNIGYNPTVNELKIPHSLFIETHILNFSETLYGKEVSVQFLKRIRDEMKFDSIELLKKQIEDDISVTRNYFRGKK